MGKPTRKSTLRRVTRSELRRSDGYSGAPKFVAWNGLVFDVTECPKWRTDMHEEQHFPGQELTTALQEAPHKHEVFDYPCVKQIGILVDD